MSKHTFQPAYSSHMRMRRNYTHHEYNMRTNQEHPRILGADAKRIVSFQSFITFLKKGLAFHFGLGQIEYIESAKVVQRVGQAPLILSPPAA